MFVERVRGDLGYALRGFRQRPGFTAAAVATLALGIGANAAVFGVVDRMLLRPPAHVVDPERVVRFYSTVQSSAFGAMTTPLGDYAGFMALRDQGRSFARVGALLPSRDVTLGRGREAQLVKATLASASLFPLLGVRPAIGRFFADDEDRAGAAPVTVLGHALWRTRFGSDSAVLGRVLQVQGSRYTVIGVAPRGFAALGFADLWLPLHVAAPEVLGNMPGLDWRKTGGSWMALVARLRPGVSERAASAEATSLIGGARLFPGSPEEKTSVQVGSILPARGPVRSNFARAGVGLAAMSVVVLLVACANVANLLLARAVERRQEIAVRLALGAGRGRLVSQLLAEGILLAAFGGVAALAVAYGGTGALRSVFGSAADADTRLLDGRVLAATAAVALLTGVFTSLVPALQATRPDLTRALKTGARSSGSTAHGAARVSLLVAQAALSVVLLVGAGLLVRTLRNLRATDLGFDASRVLVATVDLKGIGYTDQQVAEFHDHAASAARALPGVERVSLAAAYPFARMSYGGSLSIPGRDTLPQLPTGGPAEYGVSPGYFATLGTPLLRGRDFTSADGANAPLVLVVNETLARVYWPGREAVGQCAVIDGARPDQCAQVVGIAANAHASSVQEAERLVFYTPLAQAGNSYASATRALLVRPRGDPARFAPSLRAAVQSLAPDLPFVQVSTLADLVEPQLQPWRMGASLFSLFGALALVVVAIGLYSVVSFGVVQRRAEFGIRLALGARVGDVVRLVVGEGLRYAAMGVMLGLLLALAGSRFVTPLLHDVSPRDPLTYGFAALLLLAVATIASTIPSRRAARVDPASSLRVE